MVGVKLAVPNKMTDLVVFLQLFQNIGCTPCFKKPSVCTVNFTEVFLDRHPLIARVKAGNITEHNQ